MTKESLKTLRSKIDKIDKDLLELIQKRASLAVAIGKVKSKISPNTSFYKPDREASILRNILKANEKGELSNLKVKSIFKELISGCLSLEEALKIAYLGPEGTHSEAAVHSHFGSLVSRMSSPTIDDVFNQVINKDSDLGVVPVENSSEGVINTTLNCLADKVWILLGFFRCIFLLISAQIIDGKFPPTTPFKGVLSSEPIQTPII